MWSVMLLWDGYNYLRIACDPLCCHWNYALENWDLAYKVFMWLISSVQYFFEGEKSTFSFILRRHYFPESLIFHRSIRFYFSSGPFCSADDRRYISVPPTTDDTYLFRRRPKIHFCSAEDRRYISVRWRPKIHFCSANDWRYISVPPMTEDTFLFRRRLTIHFCSADDRRYICIIRPRVTFYYIFLIWSGHRLFCFPVLFVQCRGGASFPEVSSGECQLIIQATLWASCHSSLNQIVRR